MESHEPPWPDGRKRARSDASVQVPDPQQHTATTQQTFVSSLASQQSKKRKTNNIVSSSSTPVFLPQNNVRQATSNAKSTSSRTTAQRMTSSSATLAQASTSNAKACSLFWTQSKQDVSQKLWSPTVTDSLDLGSSCLNVRSENTAQHSTWFRVTKAAQRTEHKNSLKICSRFVTTLWPRTTEGEQLPSVEVDGSGSVKIPQTDAALKKAAKELGAPVKTVKVKLHPRSEEDHVQLRKIMGTARWTYNECIRTVNDPAKRAEREATIDAKTEKSVSWTKFLREKILNRGSTAVQDNPWLLETSYDIRDDARKDFATAMKGCWTKLRNGTIDKFKLQFRSRKRCKSESFYVRSRWITQTKNTVILNLPGLKKIELWTGQRAWHGDILMDCRLQRTWTNEYYLCVPQTFELASSSASLSDVPVLSVENQDQQKLGTHHDNGKEEEVEMEPEVESLRVCALDPGVRTFQTVFDVNDGHALQVGDRDMNRVFRLCKAQDLLISRQANEQKSKRRSKLKRAVRRLRDRIRNLIDEVHKQLAVHLARNYDLVMIPKFEVSQMIRKVDRKIRSKTARQMATWAHYRFRQRLTFKCRQFGCKVAIVNEAYTSKTCSCCGNVKWNLGGAKTYKCRACGAVMDRDVNGAKNIFLRNYEALGISVSSIGAYPLLRGNSQLHGKSMVVERQP